MSCSSVRPSVGPHLSFQPSNWFGSNLKILSQNSPSHLVTSTTGQIVPMLTDSIPSYAFPSFLFTTAFFDGWFEKHMMPPLPWCALPLRFVDIFEVQCICGSVSIVFNRIGGGGKRGKIPFVFRYSVIISLKFFENYILWEVNEANVENVGKSFCS